MRETVKPADEPAPEPKIEEEGPAKKSYPLPATAIICVLIVIAFLGGQGGERPALASGAEGAGFVFGWALVGVVLWGIAWLITIRHASRAWKWGSFLGVLALGILTGIARIA